NIMLVRSTILRLGFNHRYDWLLFLAVLFYPAQFVHTNTIAPDILLQSTLLLYLDQWVRLYQRRRWQQALYMSLALIAGLMIKPVLYPFSIVHVLLVLWLLWQRGKGIAHTITIALLPVLSIIAYNYINLQRTGKFHFSSTQSFNAVYY